MSARRILLRPLSWVFAGGTLVRDWLYERGVYRTTAFDLPTIGVGNLSVGGTGKTPHVRHLIDHLRDRSSVHMLSRGYGRSTHGFRMVRSTDTAEEAGDEPLMIKWLYPDVTVGVSEDRVMGVPELLRDQRPNPVLLLDDVFQHRAIRPGLNILLTEHDHPYWTDLVLPAGDLREPPQAARRADVIVVTKCPPHLTAADRDRLRARIDPQPWQRVFFSTLEHGAPYAVFRTGEPVPAPSTPVLAVTGIARPEPLLTRLRDHFRTVHHRSFGDHHRFTSTDLESIDVTLRDLGPDAVIVTTEKDVARLATHRAWIKRAHWRVFALPVRVRFFAADPSFDQLIDYYVGRTRQEQRGR